MGGIYYRSSRTTVSGNFLLHEVLHMLYPAGLSGNVNLDTELVNGLGVDREEGMSDSQLLDRFFNSGCNLMYGGGGIVI